MEIVNDNVLSCNLSAFESRFQQSRIRELRKCFGQESHRLPQVRKCPYAYAEDEPEGDDVSKNIDAFAQLIQCLDDRSLSLVMRDAKDDGRKALKILKNHYMGNSKPCVLTLYTELTSLQKGHMSALLTMFYAQKPQQHR